jgi:hypothetical protein
MVATRGRPYTVRMTRTIAALLMLAAAPVFAADTWAVRDLPLPLREQLSRYERDMDANSRCAAAFDSASDTRRMTLQCSFHIRMAAEGARRALAYCEKERAAAGIKRECRLIDR